MVWPKKNGKYTVAVDFDGVLHSYTSPWVAPHVIPDPPVPGALEWLHEIIQDFDVVILTTRGRTWRGRRAIRAWVRKHAPHLWFERMDRGLEEIKVTNRKDAALVYIDDRAWRFDGKSFPTRDEIHMARPWNKKK